MTSDEQFVDSGYFIAIVNVRDALHARARRLATGLQRRQVTTDAVLLEVGDALARPPLRQFGVALIARIRQNPNINVVSLTPDLFQRTLAFYESRADKEWGLTDCVSFVVMHDRGITDALSYDQHFIQAGFRALLRDS
ncbi:MAG: type II toxin-antitoxin system VapC family toxin [Dehalococcoidia bacterium]